MLRSSLFLSLLSATGTSAQSYSLTDTFSGSKFFDQFDFFTAGDPTNGWTQYVDQATAISRGLIGDPSIPAWGVDHTSVLDPANPTGRASIRLTSRKTWTHGLFIADIVHMPDSTCGLWPAFWTLGQTGTWPYSGEIDIIEGVNNGNTNLISGHSTDNCTIAGSGETGTLLTNDCAVSTSYTGCSTSDTDSTSYGTGFNNVGGGVYAMEWTSSAIQVWHFRRDNTPASITNGNPDPSTFGTPTAVLAGSCDFDSHFFNHAIVFDTTFCGSWAGNTFQNQGCPMTAGQQSWPSCVTYVAQNPSVFTSAYWHINSIKVYQPAYGGQESISKEITSTVVPVASTSSLSLTSVSVALGASTTTSVPSSLTAVDQTTSAIDVTPTAVPSATHDVPFSVQQTIDSPSTTSQTFPLADMTEWSRHHHGNFTGRPHARFHRRATATDE